jgi:translation initiation factor 3 subunit G
VEVAARKCLAKYGEATGFPPGPDPNSTSLGEVINIKMGVVRAIDAPEDDANKMKDALMKTKIVCRICKGDHWTTKCPFKDSKMAENALDIGLGLSVFIL